MYIKMFQFFENISNALIIDYRVENNRDNSQSNETLSITISI